METTEEPMATLLSSKYTEDDHQLETGLNNKMGTKAEIGAPLRAATA
jgi:hypothetical protein